MLGRFEDVVKIDMYSEAPFTGGRYDLKMEQNHYG